MRISVTTEHLAQGVKGSMDRCPVALALAQALHVGANCVRIFLDEIKLYMCNRVYKRPVPAGVKTWIERYDNGDRVSPFEFML